MVSEDKRIAGGIVLHSPRQEGFCPNYCSHGPLDVAAAEERLREAAGDSVPWAVWEEVLSDAASAYAEVRRLRALLADAEATR